MSNLKDLLEYLKSQTQYGRDLQELKEMEDLRQAKFEADRDYSFSPAAVDAEHRRTQRPLTEMSETMYKPVREAEARERAEIAQGEKDFYEQEDAAREARFRKLMKSMGK